MCGDNTSKDRSARPPHHRHPRADVHEHARTGARLVPDVRHTALACRDRRAPRRQRVLERRAREHVAVAADARDPPDLTLGLVLAGRRRVGVVDGGTRVGIGAQVRSADARDQRVGPRPSDGRIGQLGQCVHQLRQSAHEVGRAALERSPLLSKACLGQKNHCSLWPVEVDTGPRLWPSTSRLGFRRR